MTGTLRLTPANTFPLCGSALCIYQHINDCCRHVVHWLLWDLRCSFMGSLARKDRVCLCSRVCSMAANNSYYALLLICLGVFYQKV